MKSEALLFAFNNISDDIIEEAADARLPAQAALGREKRCAKGPVRRMTIAIAATLILLLGSFVTAMAADEAFRNAVFAFFHIETPEAGLPVDGEPKQTDGIENIYGTDIEDSVSVDYIRVNGNFDYGNGIIYLYDDETHSSVSFYSAKDGQILRLDTSRISFDYKWNGEIYNVAFCWCESNGEIHLYAKGTAPASDASWYVTPINNRTDVVVLTFAYGRQSDYSEYAVLLNLETKEITDVFSGCELSKLNVRGTAFSPDLSKALLTCGSGDDLYYCDITSKALRNVSELAGIKATGAWFIDNDAVCCISKNENGKYDCRSVILSTEMRADVFSDEQEYSAAENEGVIFTNCRYGLYIDSGTAYVLDFMTGSKAIIQGFTYPDGNVTVNVNKAGTRLLYAQTDPSASGLGVSNVGVIDFEKSRFTLLDRENYEARYENAIGWLDNNSAAIWASADENEYIYLYTFR